MKTMSKSDLESRGFLLPHRLPYTVKGNEGRNSGQEPGAEDVEKCCLLDCSILLSYTTQDHVLSTGTAHRGVHLSISIIN